MYSIVCKIFKCFFKELSYKGRIYVMKNTVKTAILYNIIAFFLI